MSDYYTGWRARYYNLFWRTYTRRTLQAAESMIDIRALLAVPERAEARTDARSVPTGIADMHCWASPGCPGANPTLRSGRACPRNRFARSTHRGLRILDVACGTGILLGRLLQQLSTDMIQHTLLTCRGHVDAIASCIEAYGIDASQDMLVQASVALQQWPNVHLQQLELGTGQIAVTPYQPQTFDLITCTNALHYLPDPVGTLAGLAQLLAPAGQLILQDYRERELSFITGVFKWLVRRVDPRYVRTYTLAEVKSLCRQAGLSVVCEKVFRIDLLCDGWALRASTL